MSAESYIQIRKLTAQDGEPIEDILQRGTDELRGLGEKSTVELRLIGAVDPNAKSIYSMQLTPEGASLHTERFTNPTLVVIMTSSAFHDIVEGSYPPLQAYLDGKLKLQGNVELGRRIIQHLRESGAQAYCSTCPCLTEVNWQLDIPPYPEGSLTLSGRFFTPNQRVDISYIGAHGTTFTQTILANPSELGGTFTVTQSGLYCGDIVGNPGVSVIVTATDTASGQSTTQSYSLPC